jgi:hypothetical protein
MLILFIERRANMSINEFKTKIDLIISFVARVNEETIPHDIKKTMVKVYANTLSINLTDNMIDSITQVTAICA